MSWSEPTRQDRHPAPDRRLRLAVLASGNGSNLQALIDGSQRGEIQADIALVVSNKPAAYALERARVAGIATRVLLPAEFPDREAYDRALAEVLEQAQIGLVVLAGYMRLLSPGFIQRFSQRIMNIHPALLPAFPGLHAPRQALEYGARFSGCTVHFVDEGMDTGPIIAQAVVPVAPEDDEDSLTARIQQQEHRLYPLAVNLFAKGQLQVAGRRVLLNGPCPPLPVAVCFPAMTG